MSVVLTDKEKSNYGYTDRGRRETGMRNKRLKNIK